MSELLQTGVYEYYQPPKSTTVKEIIKELGLEGMHFGVLLDGKNLDLNTEVTPDDKLVIIPQIKGGSPIPQPGDQEKDVNTTPTKPPIPVMPKQQWREQKLYSVNVQNLLFAGNFQTPKKSIANQIEKALDKITELNRKKYKM